MEHVERLPGAPPRAPRAAAGAPGVRRRSGSFLRCRPWTSVAIGLLLLIVLAAFVAAYVIEEPLRRSMEQRVNAALEGYEVRIGALDLHPIGLSLDLENVVLTQDAYPDPPVARLPALTASVQWGALLSGDLVADFAFDSPELFLNLQQARDEVRDERDLEERGWQQAAREIYPLEVNLLRIENGKITYDDGSDLGPIRIDRLDFVARNIRNVEEKEAYPSSLELDATVFGEGAVDFSGDADFLAEPFAAVKGDVSIEDMPLEKLTPLAKHYAVQLRGGTLSAAGQVEYGPKKRVVELDDVRIDGVRADYVREGAAAARGDRVATKVARETTDPETRPETVVRVDTLRIADAELGYVNREAEPDYRVFVTGLDVTVRDFTNQKSGEPGRAELKGAPMGTGSADVRVTFQPTDERTEFESLIEIRDVDMTTMNDLLRATGGFDVKAGRLSFYGEVAVKEGRVEGYAKPLFADLDVYDTQQDAGESIFQKAYEGIVGGVGELLENTPRDEVATRTDLSGPIENPETSTWEIVVNLIQNAFFQAIMPGLERRRGG
ncbi:MAG: DUF748 domain-containing protein [Thermodesulfobacteriota bacterium]